MTDKFKNKYRIPSNRLQGYDYGSHGMYYVTICTKNRIHYFGDIANCVETDNFPSLQIQSTQIGKIAFEYWSEIPKHYPFVELLEFVIMPNHIHGVLFFNRPEKTDWVTNTFGPQSRNLGSVIRGFKSSVKRFANQNHIEFEWQSRYHDRIIRNDRELNAIHKYIMNNPANWKNDMIHVETHNNAPLQNTMEQETENLLKEIVK